MKFRDCRETFVGGVPVVLNRISFSGELGYEIYCRPNTYYACPRRLKRRVPIWDTNGTAHAL